MEIEIYLNNKWEVAYLSITDSALIIKCQFKTFIISYKEIIYTKIEDDTFIHLGYIERINGDSRKKDISINSNNNQDIVNNIDNKKNNISNSNNTDIYTPPIENAYTNNNNTILNGNYLTSNSSIVVNKNETIANDKISQENVLKQSELNKKNPNSKNKSSINIILILIIFIILGILCFYKILSLNTAKNLITQESEIWSYSQGSDIFAYQFKNDNKCKYIHKTVNGIIDNECKYKINKHKIIISLETKQIQTYDWDIKYKLEFTSKKIVHTILYLKGDNKQEFKKSEYNFDM